MQLLARTQEILGELISFPTVSADSNLELIAYAADLLSEAGAALSISRDETGAKANLFATLGPDCFAEWRSVLATEGLRSGTPNLPSIPGVVEEEHLTPDKDSLSFLRRMKAVGGLQPRDGYEPLTAGELRRAIRTTNLLFGGRVTWHIVYGRLERS